MRLPLPVLPPPKFKAQEVEAFLPHRLLLAERDHSRLLRRQLQPELPQPPAQCPVEACCLSFIFECADKIIRVSDQRGLPSTVLLDHMLEPQIQCIVQIHVGKYRRDDPSLRSSG